MEQQIPSAVPVLPIRNAVLFPAVSLPLIVGRGRSIQAAEKANASGGILLIVAQRITTPGDPQPNDLYEVGTLCKIENFTPTEAGSRQVVVTGISRFRVAEYTQDPEGHLTARGEVLADSHEQDTVRNEALFLNLKEISREILELLPGATEPLVQLIDRIDDPTYLANICSAYLNLPLQQKQELLEQDRVESRLELLISHMRREREVLNLQREMRDKMSERLSKAQREALLREQMRTIRTELGEESDEEAADNIEERIRNAHLPEEAGKQAHEELKRLRSLPTNSAEYHVIRTYLEWLADLPWEERTPTQIDIARAKIILDEDHYGLQSVKKRILQFLAVAKLKNDLHGPILCLVGPPGVGKTSLGQSISRALSRKFIRASLGGIRDEAEIRGHRRTYVGAMPGRIIQSIKRVGTRNPVMMLDEIDKVRADFHGDPSSALLEVLDPEQNRSFVDHYLDVSFDLSDVFFICTANIVDTIPPALRDRMEIIEINGYTSFEKVRIARDYILPKLTRAHGLNPAWFTLPDETLEAVIQRYTREAGVRELERKIAELLRGVAERIVAKLPKEDGAESVVAAMPEPEHIWIGTNRMTEWLGPERYYPEMGERTSRPGVVTGLAWTPQGGELLFIEATTLPEGKGHLTLTGQLGDVMKESAHIALSLARSHPQYLKQPYEFHRNDIHVHVPQGAIPKDGPSAGVALFSAIMSLLVGQPIRPGLGMTGEITLRGSVLPVGGIKEKVLAAHRANLCAVIIPKRNESDLGDVPREVRDQLKFVFVETVEDVLSYALDLKPPLPMIRPKVA